MHYGIWVIADKLKLLRLLQQLSLMLVNAAEVAQAFHHD